MKLEAVFDHIGQLPTVPSVVQELIASFDRDDIDVASLATKSQQGSGHFRQGAAPGQYRPFRFAAADIFD